MGSTKPLVVPATKTATSPKETNANAITEKKLSVPTFFVNPQKPVAANGNETRAIA